MMDWSSLSVLGDVMRCNAARFRAKAAFRTRSGEIGFDQINLRINRLNRALSGLGLAKDDRIARLSRNRVEFVEACGVTKSGMILVPLNWRLSPHGWLATGDLGCLDAEGYVTVVDRKHDMIVSGGENVYPSEVEGVLYQDPRILEAAVFGVPHAEWVQCVTAAVVLRPGSEASAEDLLRCARSSLAGFKCPKTVHFAESLPKNAAGKILRKELRRRYGERAAQVDPA